ncbi:MAG: hypothetical protein C0593_00640 [Marinilabiliales bacterium]|nr:MAG: hypothetical protein C0593_00640 [Marinilabiliales bacterium]
MKKIRYITIFCLIHLSGNFAFGQSATEPQHETLETFREKLNYQYMNMPLEEKRFLIQYQTDTFRIESTYRRNSENCLNESGTTKCLEEKAEEYNTMVTKYYMMLNQMLDDEERVALKHSQRTWLSYKTGERDLLISINESDAAQNDDNLRREALIYLNITQSRLELLKEYILLQY